MRKEKRMIVVADNHIARIFMQGENGLDLFCNIVFDDIKTGILTNKSVSRTFSSSRSHIQHKIEPHTESSQHRNVLVAQRLSQWIEAAGENKEFDHLVLIAPPKMLGRLRHMLGHRIMERTIREIPKDMTKMDAHEIRTSLEKAL